MCRWSVYLLTYGVTGDHYVTLNIVIYVYIFFILLSFFSKSMFFIWFSTLPPRPVCIYKTELAFFWFLVKSFLYPNYLISVNKVVKKLIKSTFPLSNVLTTEFWKNQINLLKPITRKMCRWSVYLLTYGFPGDHYVTLSIIIYVYIIFI